MNNGFFLAGHIAHDGFSPTSDVARMPIPDDNNGNMRFCYI